MKDFLISCGHHLLNRNASGGLVVTDEFLKAYFARPELMPPEDACAFERRLHRELLADPRRPVGADEVAAIADADARENWQFVLAFRDLLLRNPTLEAAYLAVPYPSICRRCSSTNSFRSSCETHSTIATIRTPRARPSCFSARRGSCCTTSHCFWGTRRSLADSKSRRYCP
jgi:hypothetical protein